MTLSDILYCSFRITMEEERVIKGLWIFLIDWTAVLEITWRRSGLYRDVPSLL